MEKVVSSNIAALGHDQRGLYVRFIGGGLYHYPSVDADLYAAFKTAASIGKFFHQRIRPFHQGDRVP
jgi:hypothetical protein